MGGLQIEKKSPAKKGLKMFDKKLLLQHIENRPKDITEQGFLQGPIQNKPYVDTRLKLAQKQEREIRSHGFDSPEAYESREPQIQLKHGPEAKKIDIEHTPGNREETVHKSSPGFVIPDGYSYMGPHEQGHAGRIPDSIKVTVDVWRNHGHLRMPKPSLVRETHHIAPTESVETAMSGFDPRGESQRPRDPDRYLRAVPQRYQAGLIPPGDGTGF